MSDLPTDLRVQDPNATTLLVRVWGGTMMWRAFFWRTLLDSIEVLAIFVIAALLTL